MATGPTRSTDPEVRARRDLAVRASYDAVSTEYAARLSNELDGKPLDRTLLRRFAWRLGQGALALDIGCGPGHVAEYLEREGLRCVAVDVSTGMLGEARRTRSSLILAAGDMRSLPFASETFAGVVVFYSLVHFATSELTSVLTELARVTRPDGIALAAFHVGEHVLSQDDLWGTEVDLDFHFFLPEAVANAFTGSGFRVVETHVRDPYEGAEYPSRRAYMLAVRGL